MDKRKALYESIMNAVAKEVKKALNESDQVSDPLHDKYKDEKLETTNALDDKVKEINNFQNKSNLKVVDVFLVDGDHYIIKIYGGLNGPGKWKDYLLDMQKVLELFEDAWVIDLDVDVLDDVWTLYIGTKK